MGSTDVDHYFGTLTKTILTLFESTIGGGLSWGHAVRPLIRDISPYAGIFFCFYIACANVALLNVITGLFVGRVVESVAHDHEVHMSMKISEAFRGADLDNSGDITWEE